MLGYEELERFTALVDSLRRINAQKNGFWLILNALIGASNEDATLYLDAFLVGVQEADIDLRDLTGLCAGIGEFILIADLPELQMPDDI